MGHMQDAQQPVNQSQSHCDQGINASLQNPLKEQFDV